MFVDIVVTSTCTIPSINCASVFHWVFRLTDTRIQFGLLIAAVLGAWLAWRQLKTLNKTTKADFLHRITHDFFTDICRDILILLDNEALSYNKN